MRKLAFVLGLLAYLLIAAPAGAHPLGNFTTNLHLGVEISASEINLRLIVDMAEIPTFRELPSIDLSGDDAISDEEEAAYSASACDRHQSDIDVTLGQSSLVLTGHGGDLLLLPGQGGLEVLRLECGYRTDLATAPEGRLAVDNGVYSERLGWREMTVGAFGLSVETELPAASPSELLTNYPPGTPLAISRAVIDLTPQPGAIRQTGPLFVERLGSNLAANPSGGWLALAAAVALGIGHALAPGHGKTLMAAYLVGRGGSWRQASLLGLSVTISHTVGVGVLGLITAVAAESFRPELVYPWLSGLSAFTVTAIGAVMLCRALTKPSHGHHHDHHDDQDHSGISLKLGWRSLAVLGLAGGLLPSASAVVLLLGAVSQGEPLFGLALVAAFGLGMSAALVGAGLIAVGAVRWGWRIVSSGTIRHRLEHLVPGLAATAVTVVGVTLLWQVAATWS